MNQSASKTEGGGGVPSSEVLESMSSGEHGLKNAGQTSSSFAGANAMGGATASGGSGTGPNQGPKVKKQRKTKRKADSVAGEGGKTGSKPGPKRKKKQVDGTTKKPRKQGRKLPTQANAVATASGGSGGSSVAGANDHFSAQQQLVNEQMRRALEEDQYSALGSIVDTDSSDDETQHQYHTGPGSSGPGSSTLSGRGISSVGSTVRLDKASLVLAMRKRLWRMANSGKDNVVLPPFEDESKKKHASSVSVAGIDNGSLSHSTSRGIAGTKGGGSLGGRKESSSSSGAGSTVQGYGSGITSNDAGLSGMDGDLNDDIMGRDEGSIFGQTTGSSNATWVECDKCKKWRRLRGVVDEKKLPSKWYCSMNKNDPERSRCSAPEEEYETPNTPESAADARTRKHLRVWVRRLESQEAFEGRQPTMTRGASKKQRGAAAGNSSIGGNGNGSGAATDYPYEWVRCCNPSCGKWRALLRFMDAKCHVIDKSKDGEWYCVMNTWDEKMASCAAPQENLPSVNCPPWVKQEVN